MFSCRLLTVVVGLSCCVALVRPSKQRAFGNNLYLISNLFGVYNILKSSVVHTSVTTNQQKNNKF